MLTQEGAQPVLWPGCLPCLSPAQGHSHPAGAGDSRSKEYLLRERTADEQRAGQQEGTGDPEHGHLGSHRQRGRATALPAQEQLNAPSC